MSDATRDMTRRCLIAGLSEREEVSSSDARPASWPGTLREYHPCRFAPSVSGKYFVQIFSSSQRLERQNDRQSRPIGILP